MESDETVELHSTFKGHLEMVSNLEWTGSFALVIKDSYLPLLPDQVLRGLIDSGLSGCDDVLVDSYVMETKLHGDLDPFWR